MRYKALMLDVDGTTSHYPIPGTPMPQDPTPAVIEAIHKASKKVTVCLATGRPFQGLTNIFKLLNMEGLAITNDGAQVMDIKTGKIYYQNLIAKEDLTEVIQTIKSLNIPFSLCDGESEKVYQDSDVVNKPMNLFSNEIFTKQEVDSFIASLSHLPNLLIHRTNQGNDDKYGFLISHVNSTKQTGIAEVGKILGINTHEIIGVGDGYNDFPLLMACGLKVAMGNAVPELKAIADHVAPSVYEDGVADVIERFIINPIPTP